MTDFEKALPPLEKYQEMLEESQAIHGISLWQDAWRRLKRDKISMVSLSFLVALGVLALFTPLIPLQSPIDQDLRNRQFLSPELGSKTLDLVELEGEEYERRVKTLWKSPSGFDRALINTRIAIFGDYSLPSFCGTDHLGRDLLARLFWGARVSLIVGIIATMVSLVIGVSYGAIAGYVGGWVDDAMMRFVDVLYSVPFIFVVLYLISILSEDHVKNWLEAHGIERITILYFVIGAIYWLTMSRVVRGQVISLKNEQFVDAARTIGASGMRIVFVHLVPNVLSVVIVYLTLTIPSVMLFEAFLSFLGLGVEPPSVSWGMLANDSIKVITPLQIQWWLVIYPALAIALTLYSLNFLGDGLRDALDPRMKNK
ncbi:MAG: ABC transporter permease [Pirellulales bacterium]